MLRAWRIVSTRFSNDAFSGEGARLYGGRWNSPGTRMVYTAASISLATLELLVHLDNTAPLPSYSICPVDIGPALIETLPAARLPSDWHSSPVLIETQQIGDEWIARASSVVLRVPSAIVAEENNYLINPAHPDFRKLVVGQMTKFALDPRLRTTES